MIRRLQELRHTEQVQRAYALNCGEGATVSYEIQIRVLREFGLSDAAAELLQVWRVAGWEHEGTGLCALQQEYLLCIHTSALKCLRDCPGANASCI